MSSELSLSCQAHTESLTTIPCLLGHHTEHPKWLKLVGILQRWGSPPGNVTQSTTSWLKGKPCHTDGPSPNSSKCHWPSHRTCQTNQLEGADHSKLKQLQYYIEYSVNRSISLVFVSRSCCCSCFYIMQVQSCSYSFCRLLQTHPLITQH